MKLTFSIDMCLVVFWTCFIINTINKSASCSITYPNYLNAVQGNLVLLIKLDNNEIELCDVALIASGLIIVEAIKVQPMHNAH